MCTPNSSQHSASRILIVDDVADNRDLLQVVLDAEGYVVETATDGHTAMSKIEHHPPNLVLLDVMMPDLDGSKVAQWIAENYPSIPVLVVTGCAEFPDFCCENKVVADCIRKPIDFAELLEKAQAFIAASQSSQQSAVHPVDQYSNS